MNIKDKKQKYRYVVMTQNIGRDSNLQLSNCTPQMQYTAYRKCGVSLLECISICICELFILKFVCLIYRIIQKPYYTKNFNIKSSEGIFQFCYAVTYHFLNY